MTGCPTRLSNESCSGTVESVRTSLRERAGECRERERRTSSPRIAAARALTATLDAMMTSKHSSGTLLSHTVPNWSASSILRSGVASTHPHTTAKDWSANACWTRLNKAVIGRRYLRGEVRMRCAAGAAPATEDEGARQKWAQ